MECCPISQPTKNVIEACVLDIQRRSLLVCDLSTNQEVLVNTSQAFCFRPGDRVVIEYNGIMSLSDPPQISATRICSVVCGC